MPIRPGVGHGPKGLAPRQRDLVEVRFEKEIPERVGSGSSEQGVAVRAQHLRQRDRQSLQPDRGTRSIPTIVHSKE